MQFLREQIKCKFADMLSSVKEVLLTVQQNHRNSPFDVPKHYRLISKYLLYIKSFYDGKKRSIWSN